VTSLSAWQQLLRKNFTNWEKLSDFLEWNEEHRNHVLKKPNFPLNLPFRLAEKIQKGTLNDPILLQFLPTQNEMQKAPGFISDPVADEGFRKESKLLHKYQGRALLVCTGACAMHCRYCFRQNFSYDNEDRTYVRELEILAQDSSINEIILSGGDPLSLTNAVLKSLIEKLSAIPHIKKIRFHTRFPVGIPERIDSEFLEILASTNTQFWFILHSNHPNELDDDVLRSLKNVQKTGAVVLNQSVLLKGVNDGVQTLKRLCEVLVDNGIVPYYLHQLDRVTGSSHFEVSEKTGALLIAELTKMLPGYAVPKYVREVAGEPSKITLA